MNLTEYPEELRKTLLHDMFVSSGIQGYLKEIFGESFKELDKSIARQVVSWAGGEMTAHTHGMQKEDIEKYKKTLKVKDESHEDKPQ